MINVKRLFLIFFLLVSSTPLWGAIDWRLPAQTLGTNVSAHSAAYVGIDTAGDIVAIWDELNSGQFQIASARYDVSAGAWTDTEIIGNTVSSASGKTAALAVSGNGDATAVWIDSSGGLTAGNFDKGTSTWTTTQISTAASEGSLDVAMDGSGNAIAIWAQIISGSKTGVSARRYDEGTNAWETVHVFPPTTEGDGNPVVAVVKSGANEGDAVAVWLGEVLTPSTVIRGARFNGTTWNAPAQGAVSGSSLVSVGIANSGVAHATWQTQGQVNARRYDSSGGGGWIGSVVAVSSSAADSQESRIAVNASGIAFAVWPTFSIPNGDLSIAASRYDGTDWSAQETISPTLPPTSIQNGASFASVAINDSGLAAAVWRMMVPTVSQPIQGNDFDGSNWVGVTTLETAMLHTASPDVALNNSNAVTAVWTVQGTETRAVPHSLFAPNPPVGQGGSVLLNRFLSQTDRLHIVTWQQPADPTGVVAYRVRVGGVLLTQTNASTFSATFHNQNKNRPVTYSITSVASDGRESTPVTVTLQ